MAMAASVSCVPGMFQALCNIVIFLLLYPNNPARVVVRLFHLRKPRFREVYRQPVVTQSSQGESRVQVLLRCLLPS